MTCSSILRTHPWLRDVQPTAHLFHETIVKFYMPRDSLRHAIERVHIQRMSCAFSFENAAVQM